MNIGSAIALYFVIWWLCFYPVLTFGNRDPSPASEHVPGSEPGAPARHGVGRKALITTVISLVVFGGVMALFNSGLTLDDIPLPNPPSSLPTHGVTPARP